jgi:HNH endonuclease
VDLAVEHMVAKSLSLKEVDWDNLLLACTNCNSRKGDKVRDANFNDYYWPSIPATSAPLNTFDMLQYRKANLSLQQLITQGLEDNQWAFLLYLSATIEIAAVNFILTAGNVGPAGAWTLTGAMSQGDTLNLNTLITWLLQQLLATDFHLPSGFPEVVATGAEVSITPATEAFYAKLTSNIAWDLAFAQATLHVNNLTTVLDIRAVPAPPAPAVRPYTFG